MTKDELIKKVDELYDNKNTDIDRLIRACMDDFKIDDLNYDDVLEYLDYGKQPYDTLSDQPDDEIIAKMQSYKKVANFSAIKDERKFLEYAKAYIDELSRNHWFDYDVSYADIFYYARSLETEAFNTLLLYLIKHTDASTAKNATGSYTFRSLVSYVVKQRVQELNAVAQQAQQAKIQTFNDQSLNEFIDEIKKIKYKVAVKGNVIDVETNDNGYIITVLSDNNFTLESKYNDYIEDSLDKHNLFDRLRRQVGFFTYTCGFGVTGFIHPGRHSDAASYLSDDDMTKYYDGVQENDIEHIEWILDRDQAGYILIETKARLTRDGLNDLKSWIDGQNSDGLGEGFEQQDFISMARGMGGSTIVAGYIRKDSGFASSPNKH